MFTQWQNSEPRTDCEYWNVKAGCCDKYLTGCTRCSVYPLSDQDHEKGDQRNETDIRPKCSKGNSGLSE